MDSINQATLYLYRWWPEFSLASIGNKYNIYPKTVSQGALYCIIKPTRKKEWQFYMAEPMQQMTYDSQMTLARFIRDAMNWQTGRAISNEADSGSDGWSKLIWDLIRQAEKTAVNRGVINYSSPSSLSDNFLHLMLEKQGIDTSVPMEESIKAMMMLMECLFCLLILMVVKESRKIRKSNYVISLMVNQRTAGLLFPTVLVLLT